MQRYRRRVVVLLASGLIATASMAGASVCAGDCNGDGRVRINELILAVSIALENANPSEAYCAAVDGDGDGTVRIAELITAVRHALDGCPADSSTPTPAAPTRTPTRAATEPPLDVWKPATVPLDPACTGCEEEAIATGVAHGGGEGVLLYDPAVDDAVAQWGDCLTSMLQCFRSGTGVRACVASAACPGQCKNLFADRAPADGDDLALLRVVEGVYVEVGAPCRPSPRGLP